MEPRPPEESVIEDVCIVSEAEAVARNKVDSEEISRDEFDAIADVNKRALLEQTADHPPRDGATSSRARANQRADRARLPQPASRAPREPLLPRNVPEKLIFAIDISITHAGVLNEVKRSIQVMARTKAQLGKSHSFGLAALGAEFVLLQDFTRDFDAFSGMLGNLEPAGPFDALNLEQCFRALADEIDLETLNNNGRVGSSIVRLVMVHSRNKILRYPTGGKALELLKQPGFYFDMVHLWPKPVTTSSQASGDQVRKDFEKLFPDPHFYMHSLPPEIRLFGPCIASLAAHALSRCDRSSTHYRLDPQKSADPVKPV